MISYLSIFIYLGKVSIFGLFSYIIRETEFAISIQESFMNSQSIVKVNGSHLS